MFPPFISLSLSLYPSLYLSLSVGLSLSLCPSVTLSVSFSLSLSLSLPLSLSLCLSLSLSLSFSLSFFLSLHLSLSLSLAICFFLIFSFLTPISTFLFDIFQSSSNHFFYLSFFFPFLFRSTPSSLSAFLVQSVTPSIQDNDISKDERARRELKQMYMQKVIHYFLTATFL